MSMISHRPGQSVQLARLVLAKFSHTTTSIEYNAPLSWHHLVGQGDLVAVFEKRRVTAPETNHVHEQTLLKVIRNREVLEDLNLNSLAREATSQALSRQIGKTKPSVAVIVKSPCLAVRYPSNIGQIRRFQIKFSSDRDYYNALAILSALHCPFTESSGVPLHPSLRPLSSSSQLGQSSAASAASAPVSGFSVSGLSSHNGIFPAQSPAEGRPYEARSSVVGSSISSSSHTTYNTINSTSGSRILKEQEFQSTVPHFSQESASYGLGVSNALDSSLSKDRPSTAPVYHDTQLLNHILPPKRELPFSKPAGKKTAKSRTTNKLSDSEKRPESSPYFPTTITGIDISQTRPGLTGGIAATSEFKDSRNSASLGENKTTILPPPAADGPLQPDSEVRRFLGADPLPQQQHPELSVPFIRPNNIFSNGGATAESQSHLPPPSTVAQTSQIHLNPQSEEAWKISPTNASSGGNNNTTIPPTAGAAAAAITTAAAKILTSTDLSSYLSTPTPERTALVESWVCQQLEDDGFLKLCEDVEGVWKRIALGR
ncbi:hypothetical protein VTN00DRAFT_4956 [Thermoascus crustaceus]|uniref:uncharacterized protein n=1 Tax=Thermoascus crustaceus TaxID=5088 RepID=UPI003742F4F5